MASAMRWCPGEGTHAFHDPIRVPRSRKAAADQTRSSSIFIGRSPSRSSAMWRTNIRHKFRTRIASGVRTAFREGRLPILYCSPTMELGVDIAELNVVNLRNVPPTPANYAQRSGRAGRSGQPALVFTYCSSGSPHDQYFFRRPERMVAGAVAPPRLDLTNEDLLRSHIHSIWLAETGISLGKTLQGNLDLSTATRLPSPCCPRSVTKLRPRSARVGCPSARPARPRLLSQSCQMRDVLARMLTMN